MVESQNNSKKMMWTTLAMMAFSTVWGFGNVVNGYVYFEGQRLSLAGSSCSFSTLFLMP